MSPKQTPSTAPILAKIVEKRIFVIRGQRVMLSSDLAELYRVESRSLIQAVKRNLRRFPPDFMFQLDASEWANLKSHFVISSFKHGGSRHEPYAFTEQGVSMLSTVLRSQVAIDVNIEIMRAFVRFRELASTSTQVLKKVDDLEKRVTGYDTQLQQVFQAIRDLVQPNPPPRRPIGIKPKP
jgi:hypothetical protein